MATQTTPQPDDKKRILGMPIAVVMSIVVGGIIVIAAVQGLSTIGVLPASLANFLSAFLASIAAVTGAVGAVRGLRDKKSDVSLDVSPSPGVVINNNFPPLPFINPELTYQNTKLIEDIYAKLLQDDTTALVLTGSPGVGKSTVAALVYQYAEQQRLKGEKKHFNAEALWLGVNGGMTISDLAGKMITSLDRSVPGFGILPPQNQVLALISALDTTPQQESRLVFLDQFEYLLQKRELSKDDVGIDALLDTLNRQIFSNPNCRVVLTGTEALTEIGGYPLMHMQQYHLNGLSAAESLELLKQQGVAELENINAKERKGLENAIGNYHGHALSLTLLSSILRHNEDIGLEGLMQETGYIHLRAGGPGEHLLDYIYHEQLHTQQRQLLLAFSIFREPVGLETANAAMIPGNTASQSDLNELLSRSLLVNAGLERYQLHTLVARFARNQFVREKSAGNPGTLIAAHARVAAYYEQRATTTSGASPELGRSMGTLHDLIEAAWHYCLASQWSTAYVLMEREELFSRLFYPGGAVALLELYELLLPLDKWRPSRQQRALINTELGEIYGALELHEKAIPYFEIALPLFREERNMAGEIRTLSNLGQVYRILGQEKLFWMNIEQNQQIMPYPASESWPVTDRRENHRFRKERADVNSYLQKALQYLEQVQQDDGGESNSMLVTGQIYYNIAQVYYLFGQQKQAAQYIEDALSIFKGLRSHLEEGRALYSLGCILIARKEGFAAHEAFNQALSLQRDIQDRKGEGSTLDRLGRLNDDRGEMQKAWECYRQALQIEQEVGDRRGMAITLHNMGLLYFKPEPPPSKEMVAFLQHSQKIFRDIHYPVRERAQRRLDILRADFGEEQFADLLEEVSPQTPQIIEQALQKGPFVAQAAHLSALSFAFPHIHKAPSTYPPADAVIDTTEDKDKDV